MVADMEVDKVTDKVADLEVDKAADMTADIQNEVYEAWNVRKQSVLGRSCLMQSVPCLLREAIVILRAMASLTFASLFYQHTQKKMIEYRQFRAFFVENIWKSGGVGVLQLGAAGWWRLIHISTRNEKSQEANGGKACCCLLNVFPT